MSRKNDLTRDLYRDHARLASEAFASHLVAVERASGSFSRWLCAREGSSAMAFQVIASPGYLFVAGDVGHLIVRPTAYDAVSWLREVDSPEYLRKKVPASIATLEVSEDAAAEFLDERLVSPGVRSRLFDALRDFGPSGFFRDLRELGEVAMSDPPDLLVPNGNFLWCFSALMWFRDRPEAEFRREPEDPPTPVEKLSGPAS